MIIKTIGRPFYISITLVRKAADFYAKYLLGSGKVYNNISLTLQFYKVEKNECDYAYCDYIDESQYSKKEFIIGVDRTLNKKETLLALAHEMVHLKQYARGELKDIYRPVRMVKWHGDKFLHEQMDYWEQPWEIEAYGREKGLYYKFINYLKDGEPDIKWQTPSKRIKIMTTKPSSNATIP